MMSPPFACPAPLQAHSAAAAAARPPASLWLRVSGLAPGAPSLRAARLEVSAELAALLGGGEQRALLARRLAESPSLPAFLRELQNVVDQRTIERCVAWTAFSHGDRSGQSRGRQPCAADQSLKLPPQH